MNLDELRKLSPEQAMQAAAAELSLPEDFFGRMWSQESSRGQNMRSPAGARGHFGIMPKTQAAWEKRTGTSLNPDDFHDGLYLASLTMQENLAKWKDPVDATRAYNSGWEPAKWNNPETVGYVSALWGDKLPSLKADRPPKAKSTVAADISDAAMAGLPFAKDDTDKTRAAASVREGVETADQARRDATGVGTVASEALRDPRVMPTWTLLERFGERHEADPSYDYLARRDQIEKGLTEDEREYLRENAVSAESEQRALGELEYRRRTDSVYADAGAWRSFAGQMAAGLADPASFVMGVGAGKLFQIGRIANPARRVAGMAAENATANVAIEGLADVAGDYKTSADYVMAGAMGAAFVLPFARGVYRQAAEQEAGRLARELVERAGREHTDTVAKAIQDNPALPPDAIGRRVVQDETEAINKAVSDAVGPQRLDRVVPDDVGREMRDEFDGVVPGDKSASTSDTAAPDTPDAVTPPPRVDDDVVTQIRDKGVVDRGGIDPATGQEVRLSWSATGSKRRGHGNVAGALEAVARHAAATPDQKALAKYLATVVNKDALEVQVRIEERDARSRFDPNTPQVSIYRTDVNAAGATVGEKIAGLSRHGIDVVLHETMHAATFHRINAWEKLGGKLTRDQQKLMGQFEDLFERFKAQVAEKYPRTRENSYKHSGGAKYAAVNMHEFAAQFFTDAETRLVLDAMPGKALAGRSTSALREMLSLVRKILGLGNRTSAFEEGSRLIDQIIAMPMDNVRYRNGKSVFAPPAQAGGSGANPIAAQRARDTWAERMHAYARGYLERNPIDRERLKTLTMKIGGASDGLVLANSQSPIMQLVASLVTETTTGAAGRKANVAIRSRMLTHKFVGNAMIDYDASYTVWRNRNGGSVAEDMFKGDVRRKFDNAVYEEVLLRRREGYGGNADRAVAEAADALEGLFDRARIAQVDAGVLGFGSLPGSSKGYIPQALDGVKLQAASAEDVALLHDALARQFMERLGWDERFARAFAPFYTERARRRAMGDKGLESLGAGGEGLQLVRDTLEEMQGDPALVDRARAAASGLGQSHTKTRLDVDLLQELRPGLRMLDFYNTNPLLLARSYAKRTAGTTALTEAGIHGIRGVRELEQASLWKGAEAQPTAEELEAYRRVMAEILGTPVATAVVSNGASNMALLVSLQRLGGLVFTQAAETFNMIHHLGLRSVLSGVGDLPRMMGEVGRLKRGAPSGNHILTSIEAYGGEIGTESYKMIAPLDAPEGRLAEYVDQPGVMSRLLRAGGHMQSKLSGFRGLLAAQHRMVAEQIVMKAARYIRDGADDVALRDMGFTPEVQQAMRAELAMIAKWDGGDRLAEFDLTRVSDPRVAEAFVQAVHRGTSQIIQGTFVGERSKWFHNDYVRLLLQLRTFGLTATEKQWGRTRMNHGYTYAAGMLLGQMALTLPIHLARVQIASAGREDRDKFIKDNLHPAAMTRALMNYSSLSGMTSDVLDLLTGAAGGWGGQQAKDLLGGRNMQQATSIGRLVPVAGSVDSAIRAVSGHSDINTALKQLPFSNLWYLVPAINLTKD